MKKRAPLVSFGFVALFSLAGCSGADHTPVTQPADSLTVGDRCASQGNYQCAHELYEKVRKHNPDIAQSREALLLLLQNGDKNTDTFIKNFDEAHSIVDLNRLAASFSTGSSKQSVQRRTNLMNAYILTANIENDQIRYHTQAILSFAMAASILSESSKKAGEFRDSDLVANASACVAAGSSGCSSDPSDCAGSDSLVQGSALTGEATTMDEPAILTDFSSNSPTAYMLQAALSTTHMRLSNLGFKQVDKNDLSEIEPIMDFGIAADNADLRCFRETLLNLNIGASK